MSASQLLGFPEAGPNGSPVIAGNVTNEVDCMIVRRMRPVYPERIVTEYRDEDDDVETERELTDAEYAAALAAYELNAADWDKTRDEQRMAGKLLTSGSFVCKDGSTFKAVCVGGKWRATTWDEPPARVGR